MKKSVIENGHASAALALTRDNCRENPGRSVLVCDEFGGVSHDMGWFSAFDHFDWTIRSSHVINHVEDEETSRFRFERSIRDRKDASFQHATIVV
jgi:hypothetical protein